MQAKRQQITAIKNGLTNLLNFYAIAYDSLMPIYIPGVKHIVYRILLVAYSHPHFILQGRLMQ